jgi:UDP-N-acetylglucosamine--N-acetylmuramyl-(pentapeptide) pyrophosphoryl-undecaprenol N-acetylglucosamine transferase
MRILLTGGGTGGHIIPNLAVIKELSKRDKKIEFLYIGGKKSIEEKMVNEVGVRFYPIYCGKLRRYFSWQNFSDFFKFIAGIFQSFFIIGKTSPDLVFSKGGFVSLPVVIAAFLRRVPVFLHESDVTPGLANKIALRMCEVAFLSFEESKKYLKKFKGKIVVSGSPIREDVLNGSAEKAKRFLGFKKEKPVLFVVGGSTGSKQINDLVFEAKDELEKKFNIIHQF